MKRRTFFIITILAMLCAAGLFSGCHSPSVSGEGAILASIYQDGRVI